MSNGLPIGYSEGIARVSEIVSFKYPFEGEGQIRYLDWLNRLNIKAEEYITTAQKWGTEIHKVMENYIQNIDYNSPMYDLHKLEIDGGKKYIDELKYTYPEIKWIPEDIIKDKYGRFQGTIDLVRINEETKQVWLYDYKTYEIIKKNYGLETKLNKSGQPVRPTDKLKKLSLQLSLYAQIYRQKGYEVMGLYGVWIHSSGVWEYKVEEWGQEEIEKLLISFFIRKEKIPPNFIIKITKMIIEVQTTIPGELYSKASIIIQENDFEGKTYEEKIIEGINLQKYLLKSYLDGRV